MKEYKFSEIERKWQQYWEEHNTFYTDVYDFSKPKYYCLDMFPYPSGDGLHVGHPEGYTATDIIARMKRMQGFNVLHPIGFDSFGLPAEQFAIKTGNHPDVFTKKNILNFKKQLKMLGFSYDWSKEISTSDPSYYKHTQFIFKKLFEHGLVRRLQMPVNWCEELGTVLANDEIVDGKSERGGFPVTRRNMDQLVINIPSYANRLLDGLVSLNWPKATKEAQINWIGKSKGALVNFNVKDTDYKLAVYTTRPDTIFGVTYLVVAPEHDLLKLVPSAKREELDSFLKEVSLKSDLERTDLNKDKLGFFTGLYAIHPLTKESLPIYAADYVLASYATGSIMAVPAHDTRDFEFAKKYNLPIKPVLASKTNYAEEPFVGDGLHINSDFLDGLNKEEAIDKAIAYFEEHKLGTAKEEFKLREWIFARQRYWGEPIPLVYFEDEMYLLPDNELPLVLPTLTEYKPQGNALSPLENSKEFVRYLLNGKVGKRETNTMPSSAASSWYFMRYIDPNNDNEIANYELLKHWLPVDLYIGGKEHAVGHLLYARFITKFLYDIGLCPVEEPFAKLFHQGMILGENNEKMSKSRGNVINPDLICQTYGADSLRMYEMFMGPLEASLPWVSSAVEGTKKFLDRIWRLVHDEKYEGLLSTLNDHSLDKSYNSLVKDVTEMFESLKFNTAIAKMMVFINDCYKATSIYIPYFKGFLQMLSCIAPHIAEELWFDLGETESIALSVWPKYDESFLTDQNVKIMVQVNGKIRSSLLLPLDVSEEEVLNTALKDETVLKFIGDKIYFKHIYVKGKILNILVK